MNNNAFNKVIGIVEADKPSSPASLVKAAVPFVCGFNSAATGVAAGFNSYDSVSPEAEGVHSLRLVLVRCGKEIRDDRR